MSFSCVVVIVLRQHSMFMLHRCIKVHLCYQESDTSQANLRYSVHLDAVLHVPTPCLATHLHCPANDTSRRVISENWVGLLKPLLDIHSSDTKHSVWWFRSQLTCPGPATKNSLSSRKKGQGDDMSPSNVWSN